MYLVLMQRGTIAMKDGNFLHFESIRRFTQCYASLVCF